MSVISDIRKQVASWIAPKPIGTNMKEWRGEGAGYYQTLIAHKLQELISGSLKYDSTNPRDQMRVAKILIENIPPLKRAVQLQSDFLGSVVFGSDGPKCKEWLNKWANDFPVRNPLNTDYAFLRGVSQYSRQVMRNSLTTGMAFSEEFYDESMKQSGAVVYDSTDFDFVSDGIKEHLVYKSKTGGTQWVQQSEHFHIFLNTARPGSLWGESMVSGGEFFAEILIQMLVAVKNNYIRYGSPIGINIFTLKDHTKYSSGDLAEFSERIGAIETNFMKALKDSELGARGEIFGRIPGEVSYEHRTYGEGISPMTGQLDDIQKILRQVSGLTGIPVELLSFDSAGQDGFSGEKWRVLYSILNVKLETARNQMEPTIRKIAQHAILSEKMPAQWLDRFWVEFTSLDFANDKTQAETEFTRAQAIEKNIANALAIFQELTQGDAAAMRRFLDSVGMDYVETGAPVSGPPMP